VGRDSKFRSRACGPNGLLVRYEHRSDEIKLGRELALMPMFASGVPVHHFVIVGISVVASLTPFGARRPIGSFAPGQHGNTGHPRFA